jgi:hypothetical protein
MTRASQQAVVFATDEEWLRWATEHPGGYVLNIRTNYSPDYVVLHRATCGKVTSETVVPGAYCERGYRKVGALNVQSLSDWSRSIGRADGSFSRRCGMCRP